MGVILTGLFGILSALTLILDDMNATLLGSGRMQYSVFLLM
jgi:predicted outer membrane lipoprotein